jgi:cation transport ATPase
MIPHHIALIVAAGIAPTVRQNQDIGQTIREAVDQATREATQEAQQAAREAQQQAREAQQHAREMQQEVRDAQQKVRDAQQQLLDAQQQLRDATTADQRSEANQAIRFAQDAVRDAEGYLRRVQGQTQSTPMVFTTQPPHFPQPTIPAGAVDIAFAFFITCAVMVVGWPISRALGRRFEKRGTTPLLDASVADQLQRIEQAVEAVAIEVERISESQRFLARLQEKSPSAVE